MNETSLLQKTQQKLNRLERINVELDEKIKLYSADTQDSDTTFILQTLITQKDTVETQIEETKASLDKLKATKWADKPINVKVGSIKKTFRIVSSEMVDPHNGFISEHSPLASLLKDKKKGDEFTFTTPLGDTVYKIL